MLPPITDWEAAANAARLTALTPEQRDANSKEAGPFTGDFSQDYPRACRVLNVAIHPLLHEHVRNYQPVPRVMAAVAPTPRVQPTVLTRPPSIEAASARGKLTTAKKEVAKSAKGKGKMEVPTPVAAPQQPPEPVIEYDTRPDERDTLSLSLWQLDTGTVAALALCLPSNRTITHLRVHQCTVNLSSLSTLCEAVAKSAVQKLSLTALSIVNDNESDQGMNGAIASLLASPSSLQYLNVSNNDFTDEQCAAIVSAIRNNTSLVALDVSSNPVSSLTSAAFGASLTVNNTLQYLNLARTIVTSTDLSSMLMPLQSRSLDKEEAKALKKEGRVQTSKKGVTYRESNTGLRIVDLRYTGIGGDDAAIAQALSRSESTMLSQSNEVDSGPGMYSRLERVLTGRH